MVSSVVVSFDDLFECRSDALSDCMLYVSDVWFVYTCSAIILDFFQYSENVSEL